METVLWCVCVCMLFLQLTGVVDRKLFACLAGLGAEALHLLDNFQALYDLAENDVLAVQPCGLGDGDEELRTVRVGAGVGHGQDARAGVL